MKVLCLASHPDDEILGVGGTLLRHQAAGDDVHIYIERVCQREAEADSKDESLEAEQRLGIPYLRGWLGGTPEGAVAKYRPDVVYIPSGADLHHQHRELHERALVACRPPSGVVALYAYETPSATEWGVRPFTPQRFVDIEDTIDRKLTAMAAYASELRDAPHPRNIASLTHRARNWGMYAGVMYAEAFEVIRECW